MATLEPLWRCRTCRREFANRNQSHSCGTYDLEHHFEGKPPEIRALFDRVAALVEKIGPARILPEKTRIAFQVRMSFAQITPRPRNHVHFFRISSPRELDAEFRSWLREAYAVGAQEHLVAKSNRPRRARGGRPA